MVSNDRSLHLVVGRAQPDEQDYAALVAHLSNLGATSSFAVRAAIMALATPGVKGKLTIEIPSNPKDYPEVRFETT